MKLVYIFSMALSTLTLVSCGSGSGNPGNPQTAPSMSVTTQSNYANGSGGLNTQTYSAIQEGYVNSQ